MAVIDQESCNFIVQVVVSSENDVSLKTNVVWRFGRLVRAAGEKRCSQGINQKISLSATVVSSCATVKR